MKTLLQIVIPVLNEELRFYPNLQHYKSELEFGKDGIKSLPYLIFKHPLLGDLLFKGKIDRIDISIDDQIIIIQDYKTGKVKWDKLTKEMSRQLFIYYLVIKNKYPNAKIGVSYRKVKDISKYTFKLFNGSLKHHE